MAIGASGNRGIGSSGETPRSKRASQIGRDLLVGGSGAVVALLLALTTREPRLVIETLRQFGGTWVIGIVAIFFANQHFGQMVKATAESALATKELASAVNRIAEKDDERDRENELVMDHLARNSKTILAEVQATRRDIAAHALDIAAIKRRHAELDQEKSHGHTAGR